jgi:hypothetical protein
MPEPRPATMLSRCRAELAGAHQALRSGSLNAEDLHAAIQELAYLTETLAELAAQLAVHTETDLPTMNGSAAPPATVCDIAADLRTTANHLTTATVLLEPAIADLANRATSTQQPPAVPSGT